MKTISLKKVSAVAVASLGFGLLSVVPANAAVANTTVTLASESVSTTVGTAVTVTFTATGTATGGGTIEYKPALTGRPSGSSAALAAPSASNATSGQLILKTGGESTVTGWALTTTNTNYRTDTGTGNVAVANADGVRGTVSFNPDVAGTYLITLTADGGGTDGTDTLVVYAGYYLDADSNKISCSIASTSSTDCTQVADGRATLRVGNFSTSANTTYYVTVSGGSIAASAEQDAATAIARSNTNGTNLDGGETVAITAANLIASDYAEYVVTRATAGDVTISVKYYTAGGVPTTFATGKVTFTDAAVLSISESSSVFVRSASTCNATITASDLGYLAKTATSNNSAYLCVVPKNGASAVRSASISIVGSGVGALNGAGVAATTLASNSDGYEAYGINANGLTGTGTWTVTISDGVKSVTKTASIVFADTTASTVVITQSQKAYKDGADTSVDATDDGATIAKFSVSDSKASKLAYTVTTANLVVDSDVSTQVSTKAGQNDASATITVASPTVSALGVETAGTIAVNCSATMEKITIKLHLEDNTVASNVITFWCTTDVVASIVVGAANGSAGVAQDVTATAVAKITGKADYPVADSATATFFATGGTLASTAAVNYNGGVAKVSYANSMVGGPVTIKATHAPVSTSNTVADASKAITITDANAGLLTQIDALNAKIVALNALIAKIMKKLGVK